MRILVTGSNGQLGSAVLEELRRRGMEAVGSGLGVQRVGGAPYVPLDLTDPAAVEGTVTALRPEAVIHCAAWTRVDAAEEPGNADRVRAVNASGTEYLAQACRKINCKLVYLSTDYVFDGQGTRPWRADGEDFRPLNWYGQTKLEGEQAVRRRLERYFIVRTAWVFGPNGENFVRTMLKLGQERDRVQVVDDQIGTPTYTRDLARLLAELVASEKYGCYHATNGGGYISWYELAAELFRQAGCKARAVPVPAREYCRAAAARPSNSRLETGKLVQAGFAPLPPWQDALGRYLKELGY